MKSPLRKSHISTCILLALTSSHLIAAEEETVFDTVTVYGQKIERSAQDTKESVAVLDSEVMDEVGIRDLNDVYNYTANVSSVGNGEQFAIRGVSQNSQSTGAGTAENATLYVDGVAYSNFASRFGPKNLWDVEQVEVLRGPQSTNVGRNALMGAVVVTTKAPDLYGNDFAIQADLGNDGRQTYNGMVNVAINDSSAFRLTGSYSESDGYMTNDYLNDEQYDNNRDHNIRGQYLYQPSDKLSVKWMLQSAASKQGNDYYLVTDDIEDRNSSSSIREYTEYDLFASSLTVDYGLTDNWSLTSITSYLDGERNGVEDTDQSNVNSSSRESYSEDKNVSQELRLNFTSNKLKAIAGVYGSQVELVNDINTSNFSAKSKNYAFFTEADYYLTSKVILSAGFRYDTESYDAKTTDGDIDTDFSAFLPQAGVTYLTSETQSVSAFYKRGYRVGGVENTMLIDCPNMLCLPPTISYEANQFDPEFIDMYELAYRSEWLDGQLIVNTNAYYGIWTDQQVTEFDPNKGVIGANVTTNAGESRIYGLELETQYYPIDELALYYSIGLARTEFKEFVDYNNNSLEGNSFAYSPELTTALGANYYLTDSLYVGGNINYQGESYADTANETKLDARTLVNLNAGYTVENWLLEAYVNNLTDEFYTVGEFTQSNQRVVQAGNPREFGIRGTYRY